MHTRERGKTMHWAEGCYDAVYMFVIVLSEGIAHRLFKAFGRNRPAARSQIVTFVIWSRKAILRRYLSHRVNVRIKVPMAC